MINIIIIESLAIPILIKIFFMDLRNKTDAITICAAFIIITSIINWTLYACVFNLLIISPVKGIYEGDLNIIGLLLAIIPPIIIVIISYIIFITILMIKTKRKGG